MDMAESGLGKKEIRKKRLVTYKIKVKVKVEHLL